MIERLGINYGYGVIVFPLLLESISKMKLTVWSLVLNLNYYGIAHRISNLKYILNDNHLPLKATNSNEMITHELGEDDTNQMMAQRLWKISQLIDQLAKSSHHLQSVYSFSVLIILCASFVSCTVTLFIIIQEIFQPTSFESSLHLQMILVIFHVCLDLNIIISADLPSHEV